MQSSSDLNGIDSRPREYAVRPAVVEDVDEDEYILRRHTERLRLLIVSAVLHQSRQKWRFLRDGGAKVSAPINDLDFYRRLEARELSLTSGDALDVELSSRQRYDRVNYEIMKVYAIIPGSL